MPSALWWNESGAGSALALCDYMVKGISRPPPLFLLTFWELRSLCVYFLLQTYREEWLVAASSI